MFKIHNLYFLRIEVHILKKIRQNHKNFKIYFLVKNFKNVCLENV